jgi:hypothetical protein
MVPTYDGQIHPLAKQEFAALAATGRADRLASCSP